MAKLFASEALARITDHAVQIFGGMGLMSELPDRAVLARRPRRAHLGRHQRDPAPHHLARPCCGRWGPEVADRPEARTGLQRLLAPRHVAVFGGRRRGARDRQCRRLGYDGEIWPVHPRREHLDGMPCHRRRRRPAARAGRRASSRCRGRHGGGRGGSRARGAGGAVCYASGFAEDGRRRGRPAARPGARSGRHGGRRPELPWRARQLPGRRRRSWPDQHGGTRVDRGVAVDHRRAATSR